ncbi:MFS transporter [Vineibacter terrae]|uniref:MFS transporter n=1 Tax=Vineibacter terrae TaxID=2586908 RepID=UPI002E341146|nr:MFS transporter [Vineibacter terrae]HEX2888779.1 MFS transporter [Vineibacter terrae]
MSVAVSQSFARDARVIGIIGIAHGLSHFYQLALATLLIVVMPDFGMSYAQVGALGAVFYGVSGLMQTVAGFAVDRFGARPVLAFGLLATASAFVLIAGVASGFWSLVPIVALAGIGNCVFHPADFAILNASVNASRLGRAYSAHGLGGTLGWVPAAPVIYFLAQAVGWHVTALIAAAAGFLVALTVASQGSVMVDHRVARGDQRAAPRFEVSSLLTAPILICMLYFAFIAITVVGIQQFAVPALREMFPIGLEAAAAALTALLLGSAVGVVFGGWIADRATRHDTVAAVGLFVAGALTALIATGAVPVWLVLPLMALSGFAGGLTGPSRDMIVRGATPPGASGKVFGFVYSGLDIGSMVGPPVFGWLMDHHLPHAIFWGAFVIYLLNVVTVLQIRRFSRAPAMA